MKKWPKFNECGDLPIGIHRATLAEVIDHLDDTFDVRKVKGEAAIIFNHMPAQNYEGASIFWVRRIAAVGGEDEAIAFWQGKRNGERRGIDK